MYDLNGNLVKQLTKGNWEVTEVKGFDASGENLYYVSTEESAITKNLYRYNFKTGKSTRITQLLQVHNTQVNTGGTYVLDNFNSPDDPRTIQLIETKTGKTKILLQATNPLAGYSVGKLSIFTIKNNYGDDLYCRLFKPVNFDSTKKYPVIAYW